MNREEFLTKIKDILQYEGDEGLTLDSNLMDVEEWDSLSMISVAAFMDSEFGKKVTVDEIKDVKTVKMLAELAGVNE